MTRIVFIRHGQTDWNLQHRWQGQIDVPLNAAGRAQAGRLAARLAATPLPRLFSSDLQRARQTAEPLALAWGLEETAIGLLPGLREQGFGILEGLDARQIAQRHPALWARWRAFNPDDAPPGGESTRAFHRRVLQAVQDLATQFPQGDLAVVTHGGVLDMLWRTATGAPLHGPRLCAIPNTGLNHLRWQAGTLHIDSWGDAAHLDHDAAPA